MSTLRPLSPVDAAALLRPLLTELLDLLRRLGPEQWEAPTVAGGWRVRDVAAHLLDGELRKIAVYRDGHALPLDAPIRTDRDLAQLLNALNAEGIAWARHGAPTPWSPYNRADLRARSRRRERSAREAAGASAAREKPPARAQRARSPGGACMPRRAA
jgi:uncharacterized damage-inducible protein DinB